MSTKTTDKMPSSTDSERSGPPAPGPEAAGTSPGEPAGIPRGDFWRQLVESAGDIMYRADPQGFFTYANPAAVRLTGYPISELVGMHFTDLVRPDFRPHLAEKYSRQITEAVPSSYHEFPIVTRQGRELWIGQNVQLILSEDVLLGVQAIARDVTDRRAVEEALRQSEERFRLAARATQDIIYDWDVGSGVVIWNEALQEGFGHPTSAADADIDWWTGQIHTDDLGRITGSLESAISGGAEFWSEEYRFRRGDGSYAAVLDRGYIARDDSGAAARMIGSMADLTEQYEAEAALERSERYFRSLIENSLDIIYVLNPDGTARYVSPSVRRLLGYEVEEIVGRDSLEMVHPDDAGTVQQMLDEPGTAGVSSFVEVRIRHRDGSWRNFEAVMRNLLEDPAVAGVVVNARDVTGRKRAEEESGRLAALSRKNPSPVLQCDANGVPLHVNPAAEKVSRELGFDSVRGLLPRNHEQLVRSTLEKDESVQQVEAGLGDRIFSWTYCPDRETDVVYLFGVDITSRRVVEEQLRHDALHDSLTELPNRLLFMERLAHAILRGKRKESYLFAVLFLDLDRFKVINDSLGHHVGDELLILVAQRLQHCLRTEDTVARLGGDEFAILLEDIGGISDATRVAERIQAELSASVNLSGLEVFTSASIGIALSSSAYERPEYLVRNADMAMYRAKAAGQARFEVFDRAMHAHALARLQLETDLRRAVERQEFVLHYQPIISLDSGRICGVEALIRWAHPDRGMMSPDQFIPIAEETGLILPIGKWVIAEACRQVREWRERFGAEVLASVGVNLSAKQFSQADLVEQISASIERSGLPVSALQLEITESAVMENADAAVVLLGRLKALGVRISLDDFGTGYSSLSHLHRFPLDSLKIDRSFIGRIGTDDRTRQLVQTVLALAGSLGVSAVAEGIETSEQLATLREMQCGLGQGYHFARPLAPPELEGLLATSRVW